MGRIWLCRGNGCEELTWASSFESLCKLRGDGDEVETNVPWQWEIFWGKNLFGRVVDSASWNQENLGDLVQENVLSTGVIFSKTERRMVNKDKWFFSFTTAHLKPTLYLPTLPIK